jgi:TRAP-type mannitol/chloroaromatic compound transport system permease large subunit
VNEATRRTRPCHASTGKGALLQRALWGERLVSLRAVILPIFLIIGVLGSIVSGIATPS